MNGNHWVITRSASRTRGKLPSIPVFSPTRSTLAWFARRPARSKRANASISVSSNSPSSSTPGHGGSQTSAVAFFFPFPRHGIALRPLVDMSRHQRTTRADILSDPCPSPHKRMRNFGTMPPIQGESSPHQLGTSPAIPLLVARERLFLQEQATLCFHARSPCPPAANPTTCPGIHMGAFANKSLRALTSE